MTEPGSDDADRPSGPATRPVGPAGPSYPGPIQATRAPGGPGQAGLPSVPLRTPFGASAPALPDPATTRQPTVPQRPPVPTGVPERPTPLPPPRQTSPPAGSPRPTPARPAADTGTTTLPGGATARPIRSRKAKLSLRRLDPWSVFLMSLLLSLFLAIVTLVAAFLLYAVLDKLGVPKSINKAVTDVQGGGDVLTRGRFLGGAALLAGANVVLLTLFATLGSLLYNLSASFTGGLELTLSERD